MLLRHFLLAASALSLTATAAAQQSTPAPAHDHADHQTPVDDKADKVILPGTFNEIEGDHAIGSATAPLSLIIYASVTCPHCAHWFETTWPKLKTNYIDTNKLRVVFREFPTAPAQLSIAGFQIANCAPEKDYFAMIEHQMAEQSNTIEGVKAGKGLETFLAIAKKAGLKNETEMNACFDSEEGRKKLQKSMALADSGGVTGVPSFTINGTPYTANAEYLPFKKHLDTLLAKGQSSIPKP